MEMQRMEDLASAATLGHWPPHLLAQDEDRIYVLGQALKEATERIWQLEGVADQNAALEEENNFLKGDIEHHKAAFKEILEVVKRYLGPNVSD